jgi:hypothetical protein
MTTWPSNQPHDRGSDVPTMAGSPTWNRNFFYWRDHDDSHWTRDSDNDRSRDHGDNSQSSHDQSSDNHSTGSGDNGRSN